MTPAELLAKYPGVFQFTLTLSQLEKDQGACLDGRSEAAHAAGLDLFTDADAPLPLVDVARSVGGYELCWTLNELLDSGTPRQGQVVRVILADFLAVLAARVRSKDDSPNTKACADGYDTLSRGLRRNRLGTITLAKLEARAGEFTHINPLHTEWRRLWISLRSDGAFLGCHELINTQADQDLVAEIISLRVQPKVARKAQKAAA